MSDATLDLLVVLLPFLLALVSMLLTLEPLSQQSQRQKWKWRVGLTVFGVVVSVMTYWQQARQRSKAVGDVRGLQEQILLQERDSEQRADDLKKQFNAFVAESLRQKRSPAVIPKSPSAEEIANELDKKLSARLQPSNPLAEKPP